MMQGIQGEGNIQVLIKDSPYASVVIAGRKAAEMVNNESVRQEIHGDRNKQAAIVGSPGASIKM